jgi:hypothetical protein
MTHSNYPDASSNRLVLTLVSSLFLALLFLTGFAAAQNPVPFLNQPLTPDAIAPGSPAFELTLTGTGFVSNSVVNWNGSQRATTFENSSRLTASILASDIAKRGSGRIAVVNPGPGGGVSNVIPFEVTKPISRFAFNRSDFQAGSGVPSVVAGDFNGDGNLDIAAVGLYQRIVSVYLGNGHGRFQHHGDYPTGQDNGNDSLVVGDFNGDGKLDLAVRGVSVLLGNGDGSFQKPLIYPAGDNAVAVGDFNGDGWLDLASTNSSGILNILLGNGDGTFQKPVSYQIGSYPYAIAVGDFNRDGKLDLAIDVENEGLIAILFGNGDGSFQSPIKLAVGSEPRDVIAGDLNGDGVLDLVVLKSSAPKVSVLLGNGDGTFQPRMDYDAGAGAFRGGLADVNGDGKLDLVTTTWYAHKNQFFVLLGNGDATFQKPRAFTAGSYPLGTTFGDFNGDGILDIVIANQGSAVISLMLGTEVELQPDTLDFGMVSVGKNASLTTKLTNIRKSTLQITNIGIPGGKGAFTETNDCGNNVGGGQSCTITVTFTPASAGHFIAAVLIKDKVAGSPQRIILSGRGSGMARRK